MSIENLPGITYCDLEALIVACERLRAQNWFGVLGGCKIGEGHYVFRQALNERGEIPRFEETEPTNPEYGFFVMSADQLETLGKDDLDFADWASANCTRVSPEDLCAAYSKGASAWAYAHPIQPSPEQDLIEGIADVLCAVHECPVDTLRDQDPEQFDAAIKELATKNLVYMALGKLHLTRSGWIRAYRGLRLKSQSFNDVLGDANHQG